jgi:hypothetical protein
VPGIFTKQNAHPLGSPAIKLPMGFLLLYWLLGALARFALAPCFILFQYTRLKTEASLNVTYVFKIETHGLKIE